MFVPDRNRVSAPLAQFAASLAEEIEKHKKDPEGVPIDFCFNMLVRHLGGSGDNRTTPWRELSSGKRTAGVTGFDQLVRLHRLIRKEIDVVHTSTEEKFSIDDKIVLPVRTAIKKAVACRTFNAMDRLVFWQCKPEIFGGDDVFLGDISLTRSARQDFFLNPGKYLAWRFGYRTPTYAAHLHFLGSKMAEYPYPKSWRLGETWNNNDFPEPKGMPERAAVELAELERTRLKATRYAGGLNDAFPVIVGFLVLFPDQEVDTALGQLRRYLSTAEAPLMDSESLEAWIKEGRDLLASLRKRATAGVLSHSAASTNAAE